MAACSQGNREVATILYHWNSAAVHIPDLNGQEKKRYSKDFVSSSPCM